MKQCSKCKSHLPITLFGRRGEGFKSQCRRCVSKDNLERYHNRWETKVAHKKASYKHRLKTYGLTVEDYEKLLEGQGGVCAICESNKQLCIDHCHKSGKVRGLLCHSCNMGVGAFKDDEALLLKAVEYIK